MMAGDTLKITIWNERAKVTERGDSQSSKEDTRKGVSSATETMEWFAGERGTRTKKRKINGFNIASYDDAHDDLSLYIRRTSQLEQVTRERNN